MPPNIRRYLPLILVAFFLLLVLPALFKKKSTSGPTTKTLGQLTIQSMSLVDQAEVAFKTANGKYTDHVADLLPLRSTLGVNLANGVVIQLDASTDGTTYYGQVASSAIELSKARTGDKVVSHGCLVLKSGSGVSCPAGAAAPVPTVSTSTSTTTSTTSTTTTTG